MQQCLILSLLVSVTKTIIDKAEMQYKTSYNYLRKLFIDRAYVLIIKNARAFLKANPNDKNVLTIIAHACFHNGDYKASIYYCKKLVKISPKSAEAYNNLGNALRCNTNFNQAIMAFNQAIRLKSDYIQALIGKGATLYDQNKVSEAIQFYQDALRLNSKFIPALLNLSIAYISIGNFYEAKELINNILLIEPNNIEAHFQMSRIKKYVRDDSHISQLKKILLKTNQPIKTKILINHSLGKAMADIKSYETAFKHWSEANSIYNKQINYNFEKDRRLFEQINKWNNVIPELNNNHKSELKPIFIVGMPRSGTSLIEQILSSHSKVHAAGELEFLSVAVQEFCFDKTKVTHEILSSIRKKYFEEIEYISKEKPFFTDKMPLNFRWISLIRAIFPSSPIISIKRNPMAVCFSNFINFFQSRGMSYSNDLINIGNYYIYYSKLMDKWEELYPEINTVNYEKLTENPLIETKKLISCLGLEWEENCLNIKDSTRPVKTVSNIQIRENIYTKSSEEWKNYSDKLEPLLNLLRTNGIKF